MRGKTVKLINKFITKVLAQTPEEKRTKTREEMVKEVRYFWKKDKRNQKFIHYVVENEQAV